MNANQSLFEASHATRSAMKMPLCSTGSLQRGPPTVSHLHVMAGAQISDVNQMLMLLVEDRRPVPLCIPFETVAGEMTWALFETLFNNIHKAVTCMSSQWKTNGPIQPTFGAAYHLCSTWLKTPLLCITIYQWMEAIIQSVHFFPETGFLTMDNLFWAQFDKGGVGHFDIEYANMLFIIAQHVQHHTLQRILNGTADDYQLLPLDQIQSNHLKPSFYGDHDLLKANHTAYVHMQFASREYHFNHAKTANKNKYTTYAKNLTSLGHAREKGGFEVALQTTPARTGDAYVTSSVLWGV